jgi:hypothetical protein
VTEILVLLLPIKQLTQPLYVFVRCTGNSNCPILQQNCYADRWWVCVEMFYTFFRKEENLKPQFPKTYSKLFTYLFIYLILFPSFFSKHYKYDNFHNKKWIEKWRKSLITHLSFCILFTMDGPIMMSIIILIFMSRTILLWTGHHA